MKLTHFALTGLFLILAAGIYLTLQTDMDGRMEKQKADFDRQKSEYERYRAETDRRIAEMEKARAQALDAKKAVEGKLVDATGAAKPVVGKATGRIKGAESGAATVRSALENVQADLNARTNGPGSNTSDAANDPAGNVIDSAVGATGTEDAIAQKLLKDEQDLLNSAGVGSERIAIENGKVTGDLPEGEKLTNLQSLIMAQPAIARVKDANAAANDGFVVLDRGSNANLAKGDSFAVRRGTAIIGRVKIGDTIEETLCVADVVQNKLVAGMVLQKGDEIIKFER